MSARGLLERIPAVYAQLGDALETTRGVSTGERVSGGGDSRPLPIVTEVAEHRHLLVRGLRYWAAQVQHAERSGLRAGGSVAHLCAGIMHGMHHLSSAQQSELEDNLRDWVNGAGKVSNPVALRSIVPLGPRTCLNRTEVDGAEVFACDGQLRLMVPQDRTRTPWLQCTSCRGKYATTDLPAAADVELSVMDAAALTGTHHYQVRRWAEGGNTIRLGDVLAKVTEQAPAT